MTDFTIVLAINEGGDSWLPEYILWMPSAVLLDASAYAPLPNVFLKFSAAMKGYNVLLRLYGPLESWFDKTWMPGDFEPVE